MQSSFYIKYEGKNNANDSSVDLSVLGESILGFDFLIKELIKIIGIQGEVSVKAKRGREGSVIIDLILEIISKAPFDNLQSYYEFLRFAGAELSKIDLSKAKDLHDKINSLAAKNALDLGLLAYFLPIGVKKLFKWLGKQKNKVVVEEGKAVIPVNYAVKMHKLIGRRNRNCKKALVPFIEDKVKKIQLSDKEDFSESVVIDDKNFPNYLSKNEEILPELVTNKKYKFYGKVVGLLSERGTYMKIKIEDLDRRYNSLVAFPGDGSTIKDFRKYFNEDVLIVAHILRFTQYQKPKLVIDSIELSQNKMV